MPRPRFFGNPGRFLSSLPGRYLLGALLLLGVLAGSAWIAGAYLENERTTRSRHLKQRQEALSHLQVLRSALWATEHNLQAYSLTPAPEYREKALRAIRNGRTEAEELARLTWTRRQAQELPAQRLADHFEKLNGIARQLIATRQEPNELYPALGLMRETLGPTNRRFLDSAQRAIAELEERSGSEANEALTLLRRTRYFWSRMIAEFRLFMTARIGLLGAAQDRTRMENLKSYHAGVEQTLARLQDLHARRDLGLSAGLALEGMGNLEKTWYQGFLQVERLYTDRNWRADFPIITETLYPLYEDIQAQIQKLNARLEESAQGEMAALSRAARRIAVFPWVLVGLHLFVVAIGYLYLRRRVLAPLAYLARALRREAEGKPATLGIRGGPEEIEELSEAFRRMRREVRSRQEALEHQAFHDPLTGLPNRALMEDRLQQAILRSKRSGSGGALLMMDLDFFKEINDTFGHPTGDSVLRAVAERLTGELRDSDTVARFGGDEFGILLPGMGSEQAGDAANRILAALQPRLEVGEHSFHISGSLGIVLFPGHGEEAETLIRRADMAMYQAKEKRQGWARFHQGQDSRSTARLTRTAELYEDVLQDRITLYFQPQWDLAGHRLVGGEALLRWAPLDGSPIPVPEVLAMAQRAGILHLLTRRILNTALREWSGWREAGDFHLAVNLSADDLQVEELPDYIRQQIEAWELPPAALEVEITENDMMAEPERARRTLGALRSLGVRVAIDDYGTGYSSLGYLRGLPVDALKIDRTFVMDLGNNPDNQAIVRSTVELGQNLGLEVVAEGVEDGGTLELLRQWGCDRAQGTFLGIPLPPDDFRSLLSLPGPYPSLSG